MKISQLPELETLTDDDHILAQDTPSDTPVNRRVLWSVIKDLLKTYFDTLYNMYVHPSGDGNLHVPATGSDNEGKVLVAGSSPGSLSWDTVEGTGVSSVTAATPLVSSGGASPEISMPPASLSANGYMTYSHAQAIAANSAKITNANHTGEVTGASSLTITPKVVTLAKMADVAESTVFYRKTSGSGSPEVQTLDTLKGDLGLSGTNTGDQDLSGLAPIEDPTFLGTVNISVLKIPTSPGAGKVLTSDPDGNALWASASQTDIASTINGSSSITTIADSDLSGIVTGGTSLKKSTWANIKAQLKGYFDTLYNLYVHPSGDGSLHVPATGTSSSGKVLTAGATAGSLSWVSMPGGGTVLGVTATSPIISSGGNTPDISIPAATNTTPGYATASHIQAIEANTAKVSNATHTGDVTGSTALTIAQKAVTLAKMADMATVSLIYRKSAGSGVPEVNSLATLKTDLGLSGTNTGDQDLSALAPKASPTFTGTVTTPIIKITAGASSGKVLVSGADGVGTWQDPTENDVATAIHNSTSIPTPSDNDEIGLVVDGVLYKLTWENLRGVLREPKVIAGGTTNYPAASAYEWYRVTSAGYIGGVYFNANDMLFCNTTTEAGTDAQVGDNWNIYRRIIAQPDGERFVELESNSTDPAGITDGFYFKDHVFYVVQNGVATAVL